jgi:hypothetical protein
MKIRESYGEISEITIKKARRLLDEKAVGRLSVRKGILTSTVRDGELYHQQIPLDDNTKPTCSCGSGVLCAHLVAVLEAGEAILASAGNNGRKAPRVSALDDRTALKSILDDADKDSLVEFILSLRSIYKDIPVLLRKTFHDPSEDKALETQKASLLEAYYGYMEEKSKDSFEILVTELRNMHEGARRHIGSRDYLSAAISYLTIYDVSIRDTKGIDHLLMSENYKKICQEALIPLSEKKYAAPEGNLVFRHLRRICEDNGNAQELLVLLRIMKKFIATERDFDSYYRSLVICSEKKDNNPSVGHGFLYLEYELLMMIGRVDEAEELKKENPDVPDFRYMEVTSLVSKGHLLEALKLVEEGVHKAKGNWTELIRWLYLASNVNKQLQNKERFIELSIRLIALGEFNGYAQLKRTLSPEDWPLVYKRLSEDTDVRKNTKGIYKRILIEEGDLYGLLRFVREFPDFITDHYDRLNERYPLEAAEILASQIVLKGRRLTTKRSQEEILRLLEKLYESGHSEEADSASSSLASIHRNLKGFLTELSILRGRFTTSLYKPE